MFGLLVFCVIALFLCSALLALKVINKPKHIIKKIKTPNPTLNALLNAKEQQLFMLLKQVAVQHNVLAKVSTNSLISIANLSIKEKQQLNLPKLIDFVIYDSDFNLLAVLFYTTSDYKRQQDDKLIQLLELLKITTVSYDKIPSIEQITYFINNAKQQQQLTALIR